MYGCIQFYLLQHYQKVLKERCTKAHEGLTLGTALQTKLSQSYNFKQTVASVIVPSINAFIII